MMVLVNLISMLLMRFSTVCLIQDMLLTSLGYQIALTLEVFFNIGLSVLNSLFFEIKILLLAFRLVRFLLCLLETLFSQGFDLD